MPPQFGAALILPYAILVPKSLVNGNHDFNHKFILTSSETSKQNKIVAKLIDKAEPARTIREQDIERIDSIFVPNLTDDFTRKGRVVITKMVISFMASIDGHHSLVIC